MCEHTWLRFLYSIQMEESTRIDNGTVDESNTPTRPSLMRRLQDPQSRAVGRQPDQWLLNRSTWHLVAPNRSEVKLTATELAFIGALLDKAGQPCSREELAILLARPQTSWDNRHLDAVVNRLRRKIKDYAQIEAPIKMIYGRGYAFSAPARIDGRARGRVTRKNVAARERPRPAEAVIGRSKAAVTGIEADTVTATRPSCHASAHASALALKTPARIR